MKDLLTKKQRKLLTLLEILLENDEWSTIEELCTSLHCTKRRLQNYLNDISLLFHQFGIVTSQKGVKLEYADSISSEVIYHYFYNHSVKFQILEYLFFHENISIEQLANQFYLSIPHFIGLFVKLTAVFAKNITSGLQRTPYNLKGTRQKSVIFLHNTLLRNIIYSIGLLQILMKKS